MPLARKTTLRLLAGLLLLIVLVGVARWNATRLTDEERAIVGVWEGRNNQGHPCAMALLANRSVVMFQAQAGAWITAPARMKWEKKPTAFVIHSQRQRSELSLNNFPNFVREIFFREPRVFGAIYVQPDGALDVVFPLQGSWKLRRSSNEELLRAFDRLSAGEPR